MKKYLFLLVAGGLSGGVAAQEVEGGMLHDVVVTARPVKEQALTRTVIDSVRMAESATDSFAELLTKHSSIFVKTYGQGSTATVSFRGTAASHTQVLWNGVNINNPMLGQVDFSLIPVWFVDQTELYHGGSSLQDGSGALGGEVSLSSRPRRGEKIYTSLMQTAGSYGTYQTFFSVGGDTGKFQARLRYMYDMAENDFEYLNRAIPPFEVVKQTNADYKKHGGVLDLYYDAGRDNYLSVNAWFTHADRNLPTIMSYQGLGRTEKQTDNDLRVVGRWDKFWDKFRSNFTAGFTTGNIDYYLANETELRAVCQLRLAQRDLQFLQQIHPGIQPVFPTVGQGDDQRQLPCGQYLRPDHRGRVFGRADRVRGQSLGALPFYGLVFGICLAARGLDRCRFFPLDAFGRGGIPSFFPGKTLCQAQRYAQLSPAYPERSVLAPGRQSPFASRGRLYHRPLGGLFPQSRAVYLFRDLDRVSVLDRRTGSCGARANSGIGRPRT